MRMIYRKVDAVIQVLLLAAWLVSIICMDSLGLTFYFIVGGWQIISLVVHYTISDEKFEREFRPFACIIIGLILLLLLGIIFNPLIIIVLFALMVLSPVQAVLYTYKCISEIIYLRKRPIST